MVEAPGPLVYLVPYRERRAAIAPWDTLSYQKDKIQDSCQSETLKAHVIFVVCFNANIPALSDQQPAHICRNRGKGAAGNMSGQSGRPWWWTCWSGWSWPNSWTQSQILCCFHSRFHCKGCWKLQWLGSEWHTSNIFNGTGKYDIICACHERPLAKIPCWLS